MALAARYGRPAPIVLGIAVAAIAHCILAATGGVLLNDLITFWATSLLVALALVFSGVSGLIDQKRPDMGSNWKVGAFVTTATGFFLLERSEEHTSELQSLMRNSYAVFCLKKKKKITSPKL